MKTQTLVSQVLARQDDVGEARPPVTLRVLFLIAGLAVVVAAHAPITALAAQVIS
jgi:hypothetical protein